MPASCDGGSSACLPANSEAACPGRAGGRLRIGRLGLLVALAFVLSGYLASSAYAQPEVSVEFTCTSVTYHFKGFPELPNNRVHESVAMNGHIILRFEEVFEGSTGENTVTFAEVPGHDQITAGAYWRTNGVTGEADISLGGGIVCPGGIHGPAFTINKLQKIEGESSYTEAELPGKAGQTVDYEIIAKNTGTTPLTYSKLTDANCEDIKGGPGRHGVEQVSAGKSVTWTCKHLLTSADEAAGKYENSANVTGTSPEPVSFTHTSNTVIVKLFTPKPSFTIEKLQGLDGEIVYTKEELTGELGQTVAYRIIVHNTGNVPLKFGKLVDDNCEPIIPEGEVEIAAGGEQEYSCGHLLTTTGKYTNQAEITGNEGTGTKKSNEVVVNVSAEGK